MGLVGRGEGEGDEEDEPEYDDIGRMFACREHDEVIDGTVYFISLCAVRET